MNQTMDTPSCEQRVLVIEPIGKGHHMALYVRHVLAGLIDAGAEVTFLSSREALNHPSAKLLEPLLNKVRLEYLPNVVLREGHSTLWLFLQQAIRWWHLRRCFSNMVQRHDFDMVYIPTVDWVIKAIQALGSPFGKTPFVALYLMPTHHRKLMELGPEGRQDWLYSISFRRFLKLKTLCRLLIIDEFFANFCKLEYGELSRKVTYVPDFGELKGDASAADAREYLSIQGDKRILLVYGALSWRKGIKEIVSALTQHNFPKDVSVLFAGEPDADIEAFLHSEICSEYVRNGQILLRLHFQNDQEEYMCFRAADYVWLGYVEGFYSSSGVLHQAASLELPVVAMNGGVIGALVQRHRLGVVINPTSQKSIIAALEDLRDYSNRESFAEDFRLFSSFHSPINHVEKVLEELGVR
jgi:glycosyltransferase involved in cell wall biosynthesis